MKHKIFVENDHEAQARKALEIFQSECNRTLKYKSTFTAALSGGESPKRFYELLVSAKLPWDKIHLFWGDERCVPPDDPKSNYKMADDLFISKISIPEENVHRMKGELEPEKAADLYERDLRLFFVGPPRLDFTLLGLGTDGHTASLFPGAKVLRETVRWAVGYYIEEVKMSRLTLTVPVLNQSRFTLFLVSGKEKAEVIDAVTNGAQDSQRLPAQLIRPERKPVWLLDDPAASMLKRTQFFSLLR